MGTDESLSPYFPACQHGFGLSLSLREPVHAGHVDKLTSHLALGRFVDYQIGIPWIEFG